MQYHLYTVKLTCSKRGTIMSAVDYSVYEPLVVSDDRVVVRPSQKLNF